MDFEPGKEFEAGKEFEQELRQALERRPAPPGLKYRLMEKRRQQQTERARSHSMIWQRMAAAVLLTAVLAGGGAWRIHERRMEEQAKGEAARQQVLTALRITSRALNQMNRQLAAHGRDGQD
jgi:hypothetical protein